MTLANEFARTAERSFQSGRHLQEHEIQESVGFYAYHAFESIGSALIASRNRQVPRRHVAKLNTFTALSRGRGYGLPVSQLVIRLASLRSQFLYPEQQPDGSIRRPEDVITIRQAQELVRRVGGIIRGVSRDL